ncbi:MAG: hypothetical protein JXA30_19615 [Deltaproteobacteria bacterium]|nr:hypothetical protein [Deltaproteobacteria bacterium]
MSNVKTLQSRSRKIPLSEALILLAFVILVIAGIITVAVPELKREPESAASGPKARTSDFHDQAKKP